MEVGRQAGRGPDFDWCFVFRRPGYGEGLGAREGLDPVVRQELDRLGEVAEEFAARLEARGALRSGGFSHTHVPEAATKRHTPAVGCAAPVDAAEAERLFRDFFREKADAKAFRCDRIESHRDACVVCVDLLLDFFRARPEEYHTFLFESVDDDELFLCVKMAEAAARRHAEVSEYEVQLDARAVRERLRARLEPGPEGLRGVAMLPGYVKYSEAVEPLLRQHRREDDPGGRSVLRKVDAIRLLYDRLTDALDIDAMKKWGLLVDYFPLHTRRALLPLVHGWATPRRWYSVEQPVDEIRDYFGEHVALYFVFLHLLCRHIVWLVLASCGVQLWEAFQMRGTDWTLLSFLNGQAGGADTTPRILLAAFTVCWVHVFKWKLRRHIARCLSAWGEEHIDDSSVKPKENPRFAQFARIMPSEVDANMMDLQVPMELRRRGRRYSMVVSALFILLVATVVALIFYAKAALIRQGRPLESSLMSYAVSVQIRIFSYVWSDLSQRLVDREHHRLELEFFSSIAFKTYVFQFINSFSSFYYIAFCQKPFEGSCPPQYGGCWTYLTHQMIVVFGLYFLFAICDIVYPMCRLKLALRAELKKLKAQGRIAPDSTAPEHSFLEQQAKMETYTGQAQNEDYIQIVLPLAFVLLFGVSLPLSSLFALVCFRVQLYADAWKLAKALRRPYPSRAQRGIGVWELILDQLSSCAILTNICLVCFRLKPFSDWTLRGQAQHIYIYIYIYTHTQHIYIYIYIYI